MSARTTHEEEWAAASFSKCRSRDLANTCVNVKLGGESRIEGV